MAIERTPVEEQIDKENQEVFENLKVSDLVAITYKDRFNGRICIGRVYDSNMEDEVNCCALITPDGGTMQIRFPESLEKINTIRPIEYCYLD